MIIAYVSTDGTNEMEREKLKQEKEGIFAENILSSKSRCNSTNGEISLRKQTVHPL